MAVTYSLYNINNVESLGFHPYDYSRFKFGDEAIAKKFGTALADGFIKHHLAVHTIHQQIVVVPSPYSFIPTATFAMKNHFVFKLNRWLVQNGYPVVQETKVHRTITYKDDYGELDAEQRIKLIGNDLFHIDSTFLTGKTVLFLDDIKITGSHERMIMKMVKEYNLHNDIYMLYFAELTNPAIHPNFENYLNYYSVKSIFDLESIIQSDSFFINTRIVKYILNYPFDAFCIFIQNQTTAFINHLYNMALGNSYHTIDAYTQNLNFISNYLFNTTHKTIEYGD